jgi:hypothetical protein
MKRATKKVSKRAAKETIGADIAGAVVAAKKASSGKSRSAGAVAAFLAFVNNIEPETVEAVGDAVRERDSHRALGWVTEAAIEAAAQHGFE